MKKIIVVILWIITNACNLNAQELKDFKINNDGPFLSVYPKFMEMPDFEKNSAFFVKDKEYMSNLIDSIRKEVISADLAARISPVKSAIRVCFDKSGKVIYAFFVFATDDKPGQNITEKEIRKIFDCVMKIKIDMTKIETRYGDSRREFEFGIYWIPLVKKRK